MRRLAPWHAGQWHATKCALDIELIWIEEMEANECLRRYLLMQLSRGARPQAG